MTMPSDRNHRATAMASSANAIALVSLVAVAIITVPAVAPADALRMPVLVDGATQQLVCAANANFTSVAQNFAGQWSVHGVGVVATLEAGLERHLRLTRWPGAGVAG